ncbi:CheY-like chemotaxis protein [Algoriphagus sp. 4150]|uniref:response regulator n=1 Tax=Algoriphagus sp. 4150 TaxID=2817756 RepID=UPI00285A0335|nr:response regulator [Algoriphagus sp. 4150]MDR7130861.1 CheY-like chemotaxis protein [Algoriphagus sp. 4150]
MIKTESYRLYDELSHEIRNSLNIVIGSSELLKDSETDEQQDLVNIIHNSATHLKNLLNNYLLERKEEYGSLERNALFDIHDLLKDLTAQYSLLCKKNGLSFILEVDSHVPAMVVGSATKLTQILTNLITNAVKFTEFGFVKLSVYLQKSVEGKVKVHFVVKDSGCGISSDDQDKLFKDFVQIPSPKAEKQAGSGLGLVITRKLLHSMDSEIYLKSKNGLGSVFSFSLEFELESGVRPKAEISQVNVPGRKVLVVDDYVINRIVVRKQLDKLGIFCDTAENSERAIGLLKTNNYPIVLMDVNLPDLDGISLSRNLKKEYPYMKIILVTGEELRDSDRELTRLGIFTVLPKPFTLHELREALNFELCREYS